jgi:hypothetical protein
MEANKIIEGLNIISKYKPVDASEYYIRAEHDEIFVGRMDWDMPAEEEDKLEALGWEKDFDADGWKAYV